MFSKTIVPPHNMNSTEVRHNSLPVLYVRGSYYEVGYNVGRTFCGLIKTLLDTHPSLNKVYIPLYNTKNGQEIYDKTYQTVMKYYPQYIREMEGISDGAGVPFYKLFLLHVDDILPVCVGEMNASNGCHGCSTVCLNEEHAEIIGHTEDAFKEVLNNVYIIKAHITESQPEEIFTAFCYAGLLPGYAMGFNNHGLIYSINIIGAKHLGKGKLPRAFVARALLTASSLENVEDILRCKGCSIADAMSVNLSFLNQQGDRLFHNIEVSPTFPISDESALSVMTISPGEVMFHANKFLRLQIPEFEESMKESSTERQKTMEKHSLVNDKCVLNLLGDTSHQKYDIFRSTENVWTVAVGVFDCLARTWKIYMDNPKLNEPLVILPLDY
ncbi:beta-alanyl-dopamine/carcinine hydrolase [Halyomorpha halys]|uniref:beta-alanyl-dopamine/carcinine hydrolase n=1 Tax=Halyomorpha halys TaxID=286706 RepID=UPI0006D4FE13|nr:uncharacterized protein LOC106684388 [Halyomorpha halys]XP_014281925.1 uncharacterized protein LOC106684388 [Halyomorpha halys]